MWTDLKWTFRMTALLLFALIIAPIGSGQATNEAAGEITGDTAVPEELVLRLLSSPGYDEDLTLFVGEVPADLDAELPMPEGATPLGGLQRGDGSLTLVADVTASVPDVIGFYRTGLAEGGWTAVDPEAGLGHAGVFVPPRETEWLILCREDAELLIGAFALGEGTDLRLNFSANLEYSVCDERNRMPRDDGPLFRLLPRLVAPEGSQQLGGGSSGGGDRFLADARLITALELPALLEHYAAQLTEAGWVREGGGDEEGAAWRFFSLADAEGHVWHAILGARPSSQGDSVEVFVSAF
jgi:hypothetical protein